MESRSYLRCTWPGRQCLCLASCEAKALNGAKGCPKIRKYQSLSRGFGEGWTSCCNACSLKPWRQRSQAPSSDIYDQSVSVMRCPKPQSQHHKWRVVRASYPDVSDAFFVVCVCTCAYVVLNVPLQDLRCWVFPYGVHGLRWLGVLMGASSRLHAFFVWF